MVVEFVIAALLAAKFEESERRLHDQAAAPAQLPQNMSETKWPYNRHTWARPSPARNQRTSMTPLPTAAAQKAAICWGENT